MTQQHSPSNNRNVNNPNTNTAVLYSHKTRGTHTRVSRVSVRTVGKPPFPEKQIRSCPRCKESTNSMKILTARVGRIEQLVNALAKTTRGLISKRDDRFSQHNLRFARLDLTHCTLQELQKLVVATTNVMAPSNPDKSALYNSTASDKDDVSDTKTITSTDDEVEEIIHSEPMDMEDVKMIDSKEISSHDHQTPTKTSASSLKRKSLRQDSGYHESEIVNEVEKPSDNAA